VAIGLISLLASFELGRVSERSPSPAPTAPETLDFIVEVFEPALTPVPPLALVIAMETPEPRRPQPTVMVPVREPIIETAPIEAQPEPVAEPELVPEPEPAVAAPQAPVELPLPDPSDRFELHEVDVPPVPLSTRLPVYRPDDPEAPGEGTVRMRVLVGGHGRISSVRVIDENSGSEMQRAALNAVLRWRFSGGSHRGVPVHVWVPVQLDFQEAADGTCSVVIREY